MRLLFLSLLVVGDSLFCPDALGQNSDNCVNGPTNLLSKDKLVEQPRNDNALTFSGNASWYGCEFHGKRTASGEIFDMNKLTAAHLRLPLITKVLVENPRNGKSAVVRVNDRGPYNRARIMDLSRAAAIRTGIFQQGVGYIECTVLNSATNKEPKIKQPAN